MTAFVVLSKDATSGCWSEAGTQEAHNAAAAARKASDASATSGTFVAVPARSWKPLLVTRTTSVQVKVEAAS